MTRLLERHRMPAEPFLTHVRMRNYKSLGDCSTPLGRFTVIVGRNGSGKSNFLDALRFIADSLQTSLDHAVKSRGGIESVRRRSTGHPHNVEIEVRMNLPDWQVATFRFEVAAQPKGGFAVKSESLAIWKANGHRIAHYDVNDGAVSSESHENLPPAVVDRLYLVTASGIPAFRPAYDALTAMGFYNLNPDQMKELQSPDAGELLRRDGSNIASVVGRLTEDRPEVVQRVSEYLRSIVPDVEHFRRQSLGHRETLEFRQEVKGAKHPWRFLAASMSDGTLRTLGVLIASMQLADRKRPIRLVGIEEPETALHPAASGALMDSLREAAENTQVLVTTHSPDLLDQLRIDSDHLLVVQSNQGTTEIGPVDAASLESLRSHLFSAGELLRRDQLEPDTSGVSQQLLPFETNGTSP